MDYSATTPSACGPFGPWVMSYETLWFSSRLSASAGSGGLNPRYGTFDSGAVERGRLGLLASQYGDDLVYDPIPLCVGQPSEVLAEHV